MSLRGGFGIALCAALAGAPAPVLAATDAEAQARIARDVASARPIVIHVTVALCDNQNQGIVPVPAKLGDGQDPRSNLYWGALYGVRGYFARQAGWTRLEVAAPAERRIRERAVFFAEIPRGAESARAYLVADAWDGAEIRASLERFLEMAGGRATETVSVRRSETQLALAAGGAAHVTVFVGHNGLMDFSLPPPGAAQRETPSSSIVLACASKSYFLERLRSAGSHPLLLTTGLMAPEAYTLDAALRAWIGAGSAASAREAAAVAYDRYQKCGPRAARRLFWSED